MQVGGGGREVRCTHIIGSHDNDKFQSEGGAKLLRDFRVVQWDGNALVFDLVFPTIQNRYRQYVFLGLQCMYVHGLFVSIPMI